MKIFQRKSFYFHNKSALLKTILSPMILLYCFVNLTAQEEPNVKLKIEAGLNWKPAENVGNYWDWAPHFCLEPKLKTSKKTFIGLRIHLTENFPNNEEYKPTQFFIDNNISINFFEATPTLLLSFVPTFDYYFSQKEFMPYLGAGVGFYLLAPAIKSLRESTSSGLLETSIANPVGFLIRGGADIWKLTVGLEFNFLLEADIKIPSGLIVGTVDDSFMALSIGYSFGIGKRLK